MKSKDKVKLTRYNHLIGLKFLRGLVLKSEIRQRDDSCPYRTGVYSVFLFLNLSKSVYQIKTHV